MTVCLFIGPTLRREDVALDAEVVFLPPVAQGDVLRVAEGRPRAIGIVDGYFSGAPSVWHKEILWALAQGIPVLGSASMGALRAAELHVFGMTGIGRIFEGYRDGLIEDDDEVAVQHGPPELGYPALSEAMVNIRATLARAGAEGVVNAETRTELEAYAKTLHFPERRWPALIARLEQTSPERAATLRDWLPEGRIDVKRDDALAMVRAIGQALDRPSTPAADFRFEWTAFWDARVAAPPPAGGPAPGGSAVLEELRLEGPEAAGRIRARALLRHLAARSGGGPGAEAAAAEQALLKLRETHGLYTRAALEGWLAANALDARGLERLAAEEARLDALDRSGGAALDRAMLDELRLSGDYPRLARRAEAKAAHRAASPAARGPGGPVELRLWHFERRLGRPMPPDVPAYASALGFADVADFDDALRREYVYLSETADMPDD